MYSVIIVDDEKHCIIDLEKSIAWETYGYNIVKTYTIPEEAELGIVEYNPDVVFVDIKMPRISGLKLIENTREAGFKGEFIIASGFDDFKYTKEALKHRVFDYCLKPIDEDEVVGTLIKLSKSLQTNAGSEKENTNIILEKSASAKVMNQIINHVNLNIHNKLTMDDITKEFSISNGYCVKLFKKYLNTTFAKYLTDRKMECAKRLLSETDLSVQEVSFKIGIEDYFYFTKKFKTHTTMTPTEYRRTKVKKYE